jgi:hypothetical protein
MIAGGALVSAPILIHLINRMRFKRIRWAAMEFLLKSQKRNRRRLIIEQLILLLLRILLVLLAGFLVARFTAAALGANANQGTKHIVILDDTLSMSDRAAEKGQTRTAFDVAREQIRLMAKDAMQANSAQYMDVYVLSDLENNIYRERLNDATLDKLKDALEQQKPTALHIDPVAGVEKAEELFRSVAEGQKILHIVSDFRDADWAHGPGVEKLDAAVDRLLDAKINVSLIDVAHPVRDKVALHHDNLAIKDVRAEARVAAEGVPIEFTVLIHNYSPAEKKNFLHVKVDGQEDFSASRPIDSLPANTTKEETFSLLFAKKKPAEEVRDTDPPEERERKRRADREFVQITVSVDPEETGVQGDNVRDLVLEVRKKVPALVVDGNGADGRLPGGDGFMVEMAFLAAKSYEIERRTLSDLAKTNLELYPSILFLNVASIPPEVLPKLDDYVKKGGSVAFFLGKDIQPTFYNDVLFKQYNGLFPLLLDPRRAGKLADEMSEEEKRERADRLQKDPQPKILFPPGGGPNDREYKMIEPLVPEAGAFRYLAVDCYWRAQPRSKWDPEPEQARQIVLLPNRREFEEGDYKRTAQDLANKAVEQVRDLALTEKDLEKYVKAVEGFQRDIRSALGTNSHFNLVRALDNLLRDPGSQQEPVRPDMRQLWERAPMRSLRQQIVTFRDTVLYGDPLVVSRPHGNGRTVAFLTTAGVNSKWNDWAAGNLASWSYPVFMMELERYLISEGNELNLLVGSELKFELDATKYKPEVKTTFQPQPDLGAGDKDKGRPPLQLLGTTPLTETKGTLHFTFSSSRRPGVYTFEFSPLAGAPGGAEPAPEQRVYAFNVDADAESDLRRAERDKLVRARVAGDGRGSVGKIALRAPGDTYEAFKNRQPDASESPWLYLFFLVVLIVEQALAVHLSFHLRGGEAAAPVAGTTGVGSHPAAA